MRLKIEGRQDREATLNRIDQLLTLLESKGARQFSGVNVYLNLYDGQDSPCQYVVDGEAVETLVTRPIPVKSRTEPLVVKTPPKLKAVR